MRTRRQPLKIKVENLRPGTRLRLRRVVSAVVERVDFYEHDQTYVVRWRRGDYLGSLKPVPAGFEWEVEPLAVADPE